MTEVDNANDAKFCNLEHCSDCRDNNIHPARPPEMWCKGCDCSYCGECHQAFHEDPLEYPHIKEYVKCLRMLSILNRHIDAGNAEDTPDGKVRNVAVLCNHKGKLVPTNHLLTASQHFPSGSCPSTVSVVGPSGFGKSFLLGLLTDIFGGNAGNFLPKAGKRGEPQSTTADLHLFFGPKNVNITEILEKIEAEIENKDKFVLGPVDVAPVPAPNATESFPLLLLDSEGINGTEIPKYLVGGVKEAFTNAFIANRMQHVQKSYPVLCYLFSDVVVFVANNWKEEGLMDQLEKWAKTTGAGVFNQSFMPRLIIVFSQQPPSDYIKKNPDGTDAEAWHEAMHPDTMTERFFKGHQDRLGVLENYFSDIKAIPIPDVSKSGYPVEGVQQIFLFAQLVANGLQAGRETRRRVQQLWSVRKFSLLMTKAVDMINKRQDVNLAILFRMGLSGNTVESRLVNFFNKVWKMKKSEQGHSSSDLQSYRDTLTIFEPLIKILPLLDLIRQGEVPQVGAQAVLPLDWDRILQVVSMHVQNCKPCEATREFETFDGATPTTVVVKCNCDILNHENGHQSKSTVFPPHCWLPFNMFRPLPQACRWAGEYETSAQQFNASVLARTVLQSFDGEIHPMTNDEKDLVRNLHLQWLTDNRSTLQQISDETNLCLSCFLCAPSVKLSCSHALCNDCLTICRETFQKHDVFSCPVCNVHHCQLPSKPHLKGGYRILSLEGGGVRGLVEFLLLCEIERKLCIPAQALFDLIVCTSTGAVLGTLMCTSLGRVSDQASLAEEAITAAFGQGSSSLDRWLHVLLYGGLYSRKGLCKLIRDKAPGKLRLGLPNSSLHLAITACQMEESCTPVLFTSYNRLVSDSEDSPDPLAKLPHAEQATFADAVAGSSAAPGLFPPFIFHESILLDGAIGNNCPAKLALEEATRLWPRHNMDFLLSLGTGTFPTDATAESPLLYRVLSEVINLSSQTALTWKYVQDAHPREETHSFNHKAMRINPPLSESVALNGTQQLHVMCTSMRAYLASVEGMRTVNQVTARLFASLFYMECVSIDAQRATLVIRSKVAIPGALLARVTVESFTVDVKYCTIDHIQEDADWKQTCMYCATVYATRHTAAPLPIDVTCTFRVDMADDAGSACPVTSMISGSPTTFVCQV